MFRRSEDREGVTVRRCKPGESRKQKNRTRDGIAMHLGLEWCGVTSNCLVEAFAEAQSDRELSSAVLR